MDKTKPRRGLFQRRKTKRVATDAPVVDALGMVEAGSVKAGRRKRPAPSESSEQIRVVNHLETYDILCAAVPNGGYRRRREAAKLVAEGVRSGVLDLIIFDLPTSGPHTYAKGCVLEMKRRDGTESDVSSDQRKWIRRLHKRGWITLVGYGYEDAIAKLREVGYAI